MTISTISTLRTTSPRGAAAASTGLTRTNGYQPLFLGLLVAVFGAGASKLAAIHLGLLIQAVAMAVAAWAAYALLAARRLPWSGALAAGFLSLNFFFVLPTLTGFEMALALVGLLWAVWCWQTEQPPIITGVVCGLAALARVDMVVVSATIAVWLLARRRTRDAMLLAAASALVVAPWMIWSTLQFGSPFPDSGFIKAHYRGLAASGHSLATAFVALPRVLVPPRIADWAAAAGFAWMLYLAGGAIVLAVLWQLRRAENRWLALIAALIAGAYLTMIDPFESGAVVRYLFPVWAIVVLLVVQSSVAPPASRRRVAPRAARGGCRHLSALGADGRPATVVRGHGPFDCAARHSAAQSGRRRRIVRLRRSWLFLPAARRQPRRPGQSRHRLVTAVVYEGLRRVPA